MIETNDEIELSIADIRKLIEAIKITYSFDFSNYALTSFKRRISKFLINNNIYKIDDLISRIISNKLLYKKFLFEIRIEITELFRDPSFWRYLRDKTLQTLNNNYQRINIWIVNSSSGDEIFTLAIVLKECGFFDKTNIYATDFTDEILNNSKSGLFSISKLENSEANYKRFNEKGNFNDYYKADKNTFLMNENLLANTKFLINDLSDNAPAKSIQVILSRNNFIYYNSNLQDKITHVFYKSLALNGYMILGIKESLNGCVDVKKFFAENENEKVYKKIEA
jgi:chemotaxis protein methyltransferase CheR